MRHVSVLGNMADEVHYHYRGIACTARARREVILSGGAINSPQILLRSGIGPEEHLQAAGIATKVRLSGVGRNLQDHPTMVLQFESKKAFEMHGLNNPLQKINAGWKWMTRREGVA